MGKTRGMGAGFKVKKLRITQRWAHKKYKKSHAKGIVPKKKLRINQNSVDKQYEEYDIPLIPRPSFFPRYSEKSAVIQLIKNGDKITTKYVGKNEIVSNNGVWAAIPINESNRFIRL